MEAASNLKKIRKLYKEFKTNKNNVNENWLHFFNDLNDDAVRFLEGNIDHNLSSKFENGKNYSQDNEYTANSLRARLLIRAYRIAGHLKADLDPLQLTEQKYIPDLDPKTYGIEDNDMDKEVFIDSISNYHFNFKKLLTMKDTLIWKNCNNLDIIIKSKRHLVI